MPSCRPGAVVGARIAFVAEVLAVASPTWLLGFIDSCGLRVVVLAHRRRPGRLAVVKGSRGVQRAFELCGLTKLLPFIDGAC